MPSSLEYKSDLKILIKEQIGSVSVEDVLSFSNHFCQKENVLKETEGLIFDCRKALFVFDLDDQKKLTNTLRQKAGLYSKLKIAVVSDQPYNVVVTMMMGSVGDHLSIVPFSTFQGALDWVCSEKEK